MPPNRIIRAGSGGEVQPLAFLQRFVRNTRITTRHGFGSSSSTTRRDGGFGKESKDVTGNGP